MSKCWSNITSTHISSFSSVNIYVALLILSISLLISFSWSCKCGNFKIVWLLFDKLHKRPLSIEILFVESFCPFFIYDAQVIHNPKSITFDPTHTFSSIQTLTELDVHNVRDWNPMFGRQKHNISLDVHVLRVIVRQVSKGEEQEMLLLQRYCWAVENRVWDEERLNCWRNCSRRWRNGVDEKGARRTEAWEREEKEERKRRKRRRRRKKRVEDGILRI